MSERGWKCLKSNETVQHVQNHLSADVSSLSSIFGSNNQLVFTGNSIRDHKLYSHFPVINSMMGKDSDFILPIVV